MPPLDLHTVTDDGPFPSPAAVDANWTAIQNLVNSMETSLAGIISSYNAAVAAGALSYFAEETIEVSGVTQVDYVFPDAADWDELEFHIALHTTSSAGPFNFRTSSDGGSTFASGATDYYQAAGGTIAGPDTVIELSNGSNAADVTGVIRTHKPLPTHGQSFFQDMTRGNITNGQINNSVAWRNDIGVVQNAIRFTCTQPFSGKIAVFRRKYKAAP